MERKRSDLETPLEVRIHWLSVRKSLWNVIPRCRGKLVLDEASLRFSKTWFSGSNGILRTSDRNMSGSDVFVDTEVEQSLLQKIFGYGTLRLRKNGEKVFEREYVCNPHYVAEEINRKREYLLAGSKHERVSKLIKKADLIRAEDPGQAVRLLEMALGVVPDSAEVLAALGQALIVDDECERAADVLEGCLRVEPDRLEAMRLLSGAYFFHRDTSLRERGKALFDRVVDSSPDPLYEKYNHTRLLCRSEKRHDKAGRSALSNEDIVAASHLAVECFRESKEDGMREECAKMLFLLWGENPELRDRIPSPGDLGMRIVPAQNHRDD
jgi:hypothetical protein